MSGMLQNVSKQHLQKACSRSDWKPKYLVGGNYAELPFITRRSCGWKVGVSCFSTPKPFGDQMRGSIQQPTWTIFAGLIGIWYNRQILRNDVNRVLFIFTY
jgi:hypothetical protein